MNGPAFKTSGRIVISDVKVRVSKIGKTKLGMRYVELELVNGENGPQRLRQCDTLSLTLNVDVMPGETAKMNSAGSAKVELS